MQWETANRLASRATLALGEDGTCRPVGASAAFPLKVIVLRDSGRVLRGPGGVVPDEDIEFIQATVGEFRTRLTLERVTALECGRAALGAVVTVGPEQWQVEYVVRTDTYLLETVAKRLN
jgi:hypothetical protein